VQVSLIELATSYCELWEIPLKPVYVDQLALGWPEKKKGKCESEKMRNGEMEKLFS